MNKNQKNTLKVCTAIVAAMLLFPPFVTHLPNGALTSEGYGFILSGVKSSRSVVDPVVNLWQLLVQWLGVAMIGVALWFIQSD